MSRVSWYGGDENGEKKIVHMARVSNPSATIDTPHEKLLKYLIKHKHWSPFEMCHAGLYVETTRDISRQIIRHSSLRVQEYSQRYAVPSQYELSEARLQDPTNRQNSIEVDDKQLQHWWMQMQERVRKESMLVYQMAVDHGIAKELARKVLPEGLMVTTMYVTGSIRSWIHYIQVRTDPSTQKEHRIVAEQCREALAQYYPLIFGSKNEVI